MKKLNKFTACFLAMSFSITSAAVYAADAEEAHVLESYNEETMSLQSGMWQTESSRGSVSISDDEKDIVLNTTASSKYNASAEATTTIAVSPSDNDVSLKFSVIAEGFTTSKQTGTVSVKNANSVSAELISISDSVMKIMGNAEQTVDVTEGEAINVEIMFNTYTGNALAKINDSVFTFYENTAIKGLRDENNTLNVSFRNASVKVNTSANLYVNGFTVSQTERFVFDKVSAGGEEIDLYCKESVLAEGIKIGFSGTGAEEIYDVSNYDMTVNSVSACLTLTKTDEGIILNPVVPFAVGETIEIILPEIKDIYGECHAQTQTISFTVLSDNFENPTVSLECNNTELYIGQSALIDVTLGGSSWDYAEVYVNNVYEDTVERESFTYSFTPETDGTYTLRIDVLDNTYQKSDSEEITVNFKPNEVPQVTFTGHSNGDVISIVEGSEGMLEILVSDDFGIEKTEIYINGSLVQTISETSYSLDLSTFSLGTSSVLVKTYDIYGRTAEVNVSVIKAKGVTQEIFSEKDFIETGSSYASGITVARQRGYIRTGVVDEEYGNSMIIGKDETFDTENFAANQYSYVQHYRDNKHSMQIYEFDLNVVKSPIKDTPCFVFALRYTDGVIPNLFSVKKSTFVMGADTMPYNADEWYHVSITITKEYYSVTVTDKDGNVTTSANVALDASKTIERYRFFIGETNDAENLFDIAVDNITINSVVKSLAVTGIGSTDEMYSSEVPAGIESFRLYTDGTALAEDINKDNVILYRGTEPVDIDKIRYSIDNGFIEIYPKEPLAAASEYTVELSWNIRFIGEQTLGENITYNFRTEGEGVNVNGVEWEIVRKNLKLTVNASNPDWEDKKIYVFMSEFDNDGKYTKTTVFEKILFGGGASYDIECTLTDAASSNVEMFISDGTNIGSIYHTDIYEQ